MELVGDEEAMEAVLELQNIMSSLPDKFNPENATPMWRWCSSA